MCSLQAICAASRILHARAYAQANQYFGDRVTLIPIPMAQSDAQWLSHIF